MFPSLTRPFPLTQLDLARERYELAEAHVRLVKAGAAPVKVHALSGELYATPKGWVMLRVPNALVRGAFDALDENGAEPALHNGKLNAHISVIRPEEVESLGGVDKISERGHHFHYTLGPLKEVEPAGWPEMSKVWFIEVESTELQELRKSYGLSGLPKNGEHKFHITVAVRKKNVLRPGDTTKHAEERGPEGEYCPHCDARLERDPDSGTCNRCGKPWPVGAAEKMALLLFGDTT